MDRTVRNWHAAIIKDCEDILGRALQEPECSFITARSGFVALEMIHDHVKSLTGAAKQLECYLNSEVSGQSGAGRS
jgi:hypothetical protein